MVMFKWKLKSYCERKDRQDHATFLIRLIFSLNNTGLFRLNNMHYSRRIIQSETAT